MYLSFPPVDAQTSGPASKLQEWRARWQLLSPRARAGVAAGLLISAAAIGFYSFSGDEAIAGPPPLPNVTISQPLSRNITEWDDYTGRFEASQSVEIRPRVAGQLVGVHFQDGDIVRKGQLLFSIDRRPFQASLSEALARAAAAQTQLALSRSEYARAARLIDAEAVSQEEVDSLRAAMRAGEAGVAAAQAMVRQRQLDMEFTQIRSPVTGRISDRKIDVGNLVGPADSVLTTVFALDPIYFSFDGSEALYLKGLRDKKEGGTQIGTEANDMRRQNFGRDYSSHSHWKGHCIWMVKNNSLARVGSNFHVSVATLSALDTCGQQHLSHETKSERLGFKCY